MIRIKTGEILFAVLVFVLIVITGGAAYLNVSTKGWGADAGAWAQAAGSIIAIAGATWLARSEARQARRRRRSEREEAAWAVRFVIMQSQFDSQIIAAELTRPGASITDNDMKSWRQRAANAALALGTMLTRIDHVHAAVVLTACNAKILINSLEGDLTRIDQIISKGKEPDAALIADVVVAHLSLSELLENFDARMRGVRIALDRGDDMLPSDAWREWSI